MIEHQHGQWRFGRYKLRRLAAASAVPAAVVCAAVAISLRDSAAADSRAVATPATGKRRQSRRRRARVSISMPGHVIIDFLEYNPRRTAQDRGRALSEYPVAPSTADRQAVSRSHGPHARVVAARNPANPLQSAYGAPPERHMS